MVYTISGIRFPAVSPLCNRSRSNFTGNRSSNISLLPTKDSFSRKIFAGKSSPDSDSPSLTVAASNKILVPGSQGDGSLSLTDQLDNPETVLEDPQGLHDVDNQTMENDKKLKDEENFVESIRGYNEVQHEQESAASSLVGDDSRAQGKKASVPIAKTITIEKDEVRPRIIPPPGPGQGIYEIDPLLNNHREHLDYRYGQYKRLREAIDKNEGGLEVFSRGYEKFGFIRSDTGITYREWAPGAKAMPTKESTINNKDYNYSFSFFIPYSCFSGQSNCKTSEGLSMGRPRR